MNNLRWNSSLDISDEKPILFELFEPGSQDLRRNAWHRLEEHVETIYAVEAHVANDRHGPFLTEDVEGSLDWTVCKFYVDELGLEVSVGSSEPAFLR